MKKIQSALVLYPNQLFKPELLPTVDVVYVVEEPLFFGTDSQYPLALHKQKLVLHRASMRRYVEETLWPNEINVEYIELHELQNTAEVLLRAQKAGAELVMMFDPTDHTIEDRLKNTLETVIESPFELRILPNPNFMLRRGEVEEYFADKQKHNFAEFYQWQRERFNILIDKKYKPVGGKWIFDTEEPKNLDNSQAPGFASFGDNKYVAEAKKWTDKNFANNPGNHNNFYWPTDHGEALEWANDFIKHRLANFSKYQDTIDAQAVLLYHSGLSSSLNLGLINPDLLIEMVLEHNSNNDTELISTETFIRQIIGWREYVRGLYVKLGSKMRTANYFQHNRALSQCWYDASTNLPPVDDVISKVINNAYAQHTERLNIIGNIMLLSEINPGDVCKWFAALFIDAYDWVVVPNVYGISQFSDLDGMVNKPYIITSNQILKTSNYQKDVWCDIWDGLYWGFVEKHSSLLSQNPNTSSAVKALRKLDPDKKRIIGYRAQDFINSLT